ncbi:MAG: hypothetical protein II948_01865, partial [Synergistaceae bacterium]|nr:hypothetical protein [Synergistaceae bacterium]
AWLIARDNNLSSLLNVTSYEGHPVLWFLILMPFAKLGLPYFTLKLISYFIILLALFIIAFKSPFNLVAKFLFIFNPAFIYCYVTPARSYCLCALFIIMLAWLYRTREEQPILYGVILALTLQTHVIMAGFVFCLCVERALSFLKFKNFKKFIGLCLPFASALFLLFEFRNSSSVITNHKISFIKFFIEGAANSFRLLNLMALPCLILFIYLIIKRVNLKPILIFCAAIAWQIFISAFIYPAGNYRLNSWLFLLIWLVWVSYDLIDFKNFKILILLLYFVNVGAWAQNINTMYIDLRVNYSNAQDAAKVIEDLPKDAVIFENAEDYCNAIIPYLKDKIIYNPFSKSAASYMDRNPALRHSMSYKDFILTCREMFPGINKIFILKSIDINCITGLEENIQGQKKIYSSGRPMVINGEGFEIYEINL